MLDDPVPLHTDAGCGAGARGFSGIWQRCHGTPAYAGWHTFISPRRKQSLIFLCAEHRQVLPEVHPITDEERAELQRRS